MGWMYTTRNGKWMKQSKPKYSAGITPGIVKDILLAVLFVFLAGCRGEPPIPTASEAPVGTETQARQITTTSTPTATPSRPLLMAHYMPWYQSPAVHGYWGYHWTMNHFDPEKKDSNGGPEIATHYLPLTGPYDSSDGALLEYQVLLMKLSGIDGVIVDWYGPENFWDYAVLNESTNKLFQAIQKAGLLFAICYEDQTVKHMVENKHIADKDIYTRGQDDMRYLQDTWFLQDAYLKTSGRPVLLNFGPQYFVNGSDWEMLFSGLDPRPVFITLDNHPLPAATGSFAWPPMWASQNGVLSQEALENYLETFYKKAEAWDYRVAGAFPGFHDIYKEAGVGEGYGFLDAQGVKTFQSTLQSAINRKPDVIQLITWNDYGEGTIIEPTVEFGYQYLEMVQEARRSMPVDNFRFSAEDLRLPLKLFHARNTYAHDAVANAQLDKAYESILSGDLKTAEGILANYP